MLVPETVTCHYLPMPLRGMELARDEVGDDPIAFYIIETDDDEMIQAQCKHP